MASYTCNRCDSSVQVDATKGVSQDVLDAWSAAAPSASLPKHALEEGDQSLVVILSQDSAPEPITQTELATRELSQAAQNSSRKGKAVTKLLEIVEEYSQLEQPLCGGCLDEMTRLLDEQNKELDAREAAYTMALGHLQSQEDRFRQDADPAGMRLAREAAELTANLRRMQGVRLTVEAEVAKAEQDLQDLVKMEADFMDQTTDFLIDLDRLSEERGRIEQGLKLRADQLNTLKRTNVWDDAFHISHEGHFGTINGFRLGKLASQPVEWDEINAALGQCVLLLDTLAHSASVRFSKYSLLPRGSFSRIRRRTKAGEHAVNELDHTRELYSSSDSKSFSRVNWYKRFDEGLVWLLECIQEFGEQATLQQTSFAAKYRIEGDKIGSQAVMVSIRRQGNKDENWTRALKYMLTNLRNLLVWVVKSVVREQEAQQMRAPRPVL